MLVMKMDCLESEGGEEAGRTSAPQIDDSLKVALRLHHNQHKVCHLGADIFFGTRSACQKYISLFNFSLSFLCGWAHRTRKSSGLLSNPVG